MFSIVFDELEGLSLYQLYRERSRLMDLRRTPRGYTVEDNLRLRVVLAVIAKRIIPR